MRITIYKIELNNDLHTKLVKEKAYNHDVKNLNNPSSIVQVMNDVFHMNKLSEEYLYTIALNRKLKPITRQTKHILEAFTKMKMELFSLGIRTKFILIIGSELL